MQGNGEVEGGPLSPFRVPPGFSGLRRSWFLWEGGWGWGPGWRFLVESPGTAQPLWYRLDLAAGGWMLELEPPFFLPCTLCAYS